MNIAERNQNFIDREKLYGLIEGQNPTTDEINTVLNKARKLKGLSLEDVALLLRVEAHADIIKIMETSHYVKKEIYG